MKIYYKHIAFLMVISLSTSFARAEETDIIIDLSAMSWAGKPEKVNVTLVHADGNRTILKEVSGKIVLKKGAGTSAPKKTYSQDDGPFNVEIRSSSYQIPPHKVIGRCDNIAGTANGAEVVVNFETFLGGPIGYSCKKRR